MNNNIFVSNVKQISNKASKNSPAILIFLGLTGMLTTVVMACKATPKANEALEELYDERLQSDKEVGKVKQKMQEVRAVAPAYIPTAIMGLTSAACFIGSYKISAKRTAALATAYSLTDKTLKEYQRKVIETIGERKEEKLRDEISRDRVNNNPPIDEEIINTGNGEQLCLDTLTGRYFRSSVDTIRKAESLLNRRIYTEMYVSLNDFFDEIGLPHCGIGDDIGWNVDNEIDFDFSSQLTQSNVPCLVIEYDYAPRYDFRSLM